MKSKPIALALAALLALSSLAGCAPAAPSPSPAPSAPASGAPPQAGTVPEEQAGAGWTFTDSAGRQVEIPAGITKVAPSGAFAQMVLLALAPDMMVSLASPYTGEAAEFLGEDFVGLPVIGQFYGTDDLNLEEVAALGPQLVIDLGETKAGSAEDMDSITQSIAVPAVHIRATTQTMGGAFRTLGRLLGREAEAERLAAYCEDTLAEIEGIMAEVDAAGQRVNLVYCLGDSGQNVIASGSFHAEVINLMANNLAQVEEPSSKGTGNEVNLEQLMLWDPDWILFAPDSIYDTVGGDPAWQQLAAIRAGSYYRVPFGPYNWMGFPPSVNRWLGMLWAAKLFYPQQADYDLYQRAAEYFQLFYHTELSEEQFARLTENALPRP